MTHALATRRIRYDYDDTRYTLVPPYTLPRRLHAQVLRLLPVTTHLTPAYAVDRHDLP